MGDFAILCSGSYLWFLAKNRPFFTKKMTQKCRWDKTKFLGFSVFAIFETPKNDHFWTTFWTTFWPLFVHFLDHFWTTFEHPFYNEDYLKWVILGHHFGPIFGPLFGPLLSHFWPKMGHFWTPQNAKFDVLTPKCQVLGGPARSETPPETTFWTLFWRFVEAPLIWTPEIWGSEINGPKRVQKHPKMGHFQGFGGHRHQ